MSKPSKIIAARNIASLVRQLRKKKQSIVFTNGTFDILHLGHVTYLEKAKSFGDVLIVGVNSDASVKSYKNPNRPINPQNDRLRVLAALECVSFAVLFQDPTPIRLIMSIRPDVLVKGSDWKKSQIAGAREVESWGGEVRLIPLVKDRSTTRILKLLHVE